METLFQSDNVTVRELLQTQLLLLLLLLGYLAHCSYSIRRAAGARHDNHRKAERRRQWTYWHGNSATDDLIKRLHKRAHAHTHTGTQNGQYVCVW